MPIIDLHTHTTHSDGTLSPQELIHKALERNITTLSITDHDTMSGAREALSLVQSNEIGILMEIIPAIEMSAFDATIGKEYHILGYYIDCCHSALQQYEEYCRTQRQQRAETIVEKLRTIGVMLDWQDVLAQTTAGGVLGRQHIALALCKAHLTHSPKQAFDKYLAEGRPAFVEKWRFSVEEAIRLIHEAGGVAILAHPARTIHGLLLVHFVKEGLDGVEVINPSHDAYLQRSYEQFAKGYGLFMTGGSDYHGNKWGDETNFGKFSAAAEHVAALRRSREGELADW